MRKLLFLLSACTLGYASTYTFSVVAFADCAVTGCYQRANTSDTTFLTGWAATGTGFSFNGSPVTGKVLGVFADGEITYDPTPGHGPFCNGFNLLVATPLSIDMTTGAGTVIAQNCMADFGGSSDIHWTPGDATTTGVCGAGDWTAGGSRVPDCTWKPASSVLCIDGACYVWVHRASSSGVGMFGDGTMLKSTDLGLTWANPYILGSPSATGGAPPSPLQTGYSTAIMFPGDPATTRINAPNLVMWLQYGQDGATWPNVDNNGTYVYALVNDANFHGFKVLSVERANMMDKTKYKWYYCPTYPTTICDGLDRGNWVSTFVGGTEVTTIALAPLGSAFYSSAFGTYLSFGADHAGGIYFGSFPHPWGPFTTSAQTYNPGGVNPVLGFVGAMMPTLQAVDANKIRVTLSATEYNRSGSGNLAYYTVEIARSGTTPGLKLFPMPW